MIEVLFNCGSLWTVKVETEDDYKFMEALDICLELMNENLEIAVKVGEELQDKGMMWKCVDCGKKLTKENAAILLYENKDFNPLCEVCELYYLKTHIKGVEDEMGMTV